MSSLFEMLNNSGDGLAASLERSWKRGSLQQKNGAAMGHRSTWYFSGRKARDICLVLSQIGFELGIGKIVEFI